MALAQQIMLVAIPAFFVLMALEWWVARRLGRAVYRLNDAIASVALGTLSQVTGVFAKLLAIGVYAWASQHLAIVALPLDDPWVWVTGLVLYDFLYYWHHRAGHEVGALWAAHAVHHQSERYNLSTALRQPATGVLLGWVFYLPMAALGYPVEVFAVVAVIDLLYQFWIHTELVPRLGWFDKVFASPSNHRVHHAVNDRYLDRNYGGILMLWDHLFGTYAGEDPAEPCVYGTRAPLRSWNPLWANLQVYAQLLADSVRARRWRDRLAVWVAPPGWRPADVAARDPKPAFTLARAEYDPPASRALRVYAGVQFLGLLAFGTHFLQHAASVAPWVRGGYALFLVAGLVAIAGLLERRAWAPLLESLRLLALGMAPATLGFLPGVPQLPLGVRGLVPLLVVPVVLWLWAAWRAREGAPALPAQAALS